MSAADRRLEEAAAPLLRPEEKIEAWGGAMPGEELTKSRLKASLRSMTVRAPLARAIVLTDQRLLMLAETATRARPKSELVFEAPRHGLRVVADGKAGLYRWLELEWAQQQGTTLRLNFPRRERSRAERFLSLLGPGG